ncbi:hypothetical protein COV04_01045 [Candidatus Uhrbacteria bacterium CG10_big_fil_rev_8_21_14_0_10_48_11]|uniref:prephenate dehydratase n=1 Tax=Candidatus Uhrbacteria bacterium CG10_big_fil_rev_8_21_14_0_10_48_11 TaxID=1975037 RepID=A0A2M8LF80_9BACT|nr:MAG: hypothetical protein COV04_01045 [Candidatus Uhrbacteria bacterium CG10_big_fil_rev_8_21_14_0_10_48_11]
MKQKRVGYLGPKGAPFGWRVAQAYAAEIQLVPFPSHTDIVEAVSESQLERGIVSIENRWDRAVTETTRAIWRYGKDRIRVVEELRTAVILYCPQRNDGTWPPGAVKSYAAAFGQCRNFLSALVHVGIKTENAPSTGAAAQSAADDFTVAAIASLRNWRLAHMDSKSTRWSLMIREIKPASSSLHQRMSSSRQKPKAIGLPCSFGW